MRISPDLMAAETSLAVFPSMEHPMDEQVPNTSRTVPLSSRASERTLTFLAISTIWSIVRFPWCFTRKMNEIGKITVLFLLAISRRLLQCLDDETGCGGLKFYGCNTIGNSQLDTDTQSFVFHRGLCNIILYLFRRNTEGTNLLSQRGTSSLTTNGTDKN